MPGRPTTIYGLIDPRTNELRYVGKTIKPLSKRIIDHESLARRRATRHWVARWVATLLEAGRRPDVVVLEVVPPDQDWVAAEQFWIQYWRFVGANLANIGAGGEGGGVGYAHSPETKRKIGDSHRGRKRSPEFCAQMSRERKGKRLRPETIEKLRALHSSAEGRARCAANARKMTRECVAAIAEKLRGRRLSTEHKQKVSSSLKGRRLSDEHRASLSAALAGRKVSREGCAKLSAQRKARVTPEFTEAARRMFDAVRAKAIKARWTPEARARQSEIMRARRAAMKLRAE